jgi:hypothetical protein
MDQGLDLSIDPPAYAGGTDCKCYFLASYEAFPDDAEPIPGDAGWFQRAVERFLSQTKTLQSRSVNLRSRFVNLHRHVINFPRRFVSFQNPLC